MSDKSRSKTEKKSVKFCQNCNSRLGKGDPHELCLRCLPQDHIFHPEECELCKQMSAQSRSRRKLSYKTYLETGLWSETPTKKPHATSGQGSSHTPASSAPLGPNVRSQGGTPMGKEGGERRGASPNPSPIDQSAGPLRVDDTPLEIHPEDDRFNESEKDDSQDDHDRRVVLTNKNDQNSESSSESGSEGSRQSEIVSSPKTSRKVLTKAEQKVTPRNSEASNKASDKYGQNSGSRVKRSKASKRKRSPSSSTSSSEDSSAHRRRSRKKKSKSKKRSHDRRPKHSKRKYRRKYESPSSSSSSDDSSEEEPPRKRKAKRSQGEDSNENLTRLFETMQKNMEKSMAEREKASIARLQAFEEEIRRSMPNALQAAGPRQEELTSEDLPSQPGEEPLYGDIAHFPRTSASGPVSSTPLGMSVSSVTSEKPESDGDDVDDPSVRTRAESHASRRAIISHTLSPLGPFDFHVDSHEATSIAEQIQLGLAPSAPNSLIIPIQQAVLDQLKKSARQSSKGSKSAKSRRPDGVLKKMYRVAEDQQDVWDKPPAPPPELLRIVDDRFKYRDPKKELTVLNRKSASHSANLERRALELFSTAQTQLKISNCLTLAVAATRELVKDVTSQVSSYIGESTKDEGDRPSAEELACKGRNIMEKLSYVSTVIEESQINAHDSMQLHCQAYVASAKDRRDLWLDTARLNPDRKVELKALPVHIPPKLSADEVYWDILGKPAREKIKEWSDADLQQSQIQATRKAAANRYAGQANQGGKGRPGQFKGQSKPKPPQTAQPFRASQSATPTKQDYKPKKGQWHGKKFGKKGKNQQ